MTIRAPIRHVTAASAVAALLTAAAACSSAHPPAFDTGGVTKIEITNNGNRAKVTASRAKDNLYELLDALHLGQLKASNRRQATAPTRPAYTAILYHDEDHTLTVDIPDTPTSSTVYVHDPAHPDHDGTYPVTDPVKAADLDTFIHKYQG